MATRLHQHLRYGEKTCDWDFSENLLGYKIQVVVCPEMDDLYTATVQVQKIMIKHEIYFEVP